MTEYPSWYLGPRAEAVADFRDPAAAIREYESSNNYWIGFGGTDLSSAPLDQYGFPQWAGSGNSHAAGAYQFEPATWKIYAAPLGITDFSPRSQDAVFAACFDRRGFADWLPYNAKLAAAIKAAGGVGVYSLGATWLAMSQTTPPPPPSGEDTIFVPAEVSGKSGNKYKVAIGTASAVVVAGIMGAAYLAPSPTPTAAAWQGALPPLSMAHIDGPRSPYLDDDAMVGEVVSNGPTLCVNRKDLRMLVGGCVLALAPSDAGR